MKRAERIALARTRLSNVDAIAKASKKAGLPLWAACALMEKESGGRNVYGHDSGGVFSHDEHPEVDARNFMRFFVQVMRGATSNGVGPCQITYAGTLEGGHRDGGLFRQMIEQGLLPWVPVDNMTYGFRLLADYHAKAQSWRTAGERYNGADAYGVDLARRCNEWRARFGLNGTVR